MKTNYIEENKLAKNSNFDFGLTLEIQRLFACENVAFIIELTREMKISYTIPSLALQISINFFHKKCYVHYDRFIILTACLLLASKLKNIECRVKFLCNGFYNVISRATNNIEPFNEEKMKKIKDQISIYECEILRTLEFEIEPVTPHEYLKKECDLLLPDK